MTAKTTAERQRDYKARQRAAGRTELRGVFLRPEDQAAVRAFAANIGLTQINQPCDNPPQIRNGNR